MRFCNAVNDDLIHRYCDQIDRSQTTVVGCFVNGTLRGIAELVRIPEGVPVGAELAVSVERAYQEQGVGGKLLQKVLLLARNRFVDTVHMISLRENEKVQHLVRKFGANLGAYGTMSEGQIRLPSPSYLSLAKEITTDGHALVNAVFELPIEQMIAGAALEHQ
jgi:GNAT superfamily N-acetyltransferase